MNSEHDPENQVGNRRRSSPFGRMERLPPLLVALYLGLLAITIMFVMLVAAYVATRLRSGVPTGCTRCRAIFRSAPSCWC
ncbi:MAG: hypothetical protein NVSMB30_15080 [Hymenobacter sp.]